MADVAALVYYHDASSTYNLFCQSLSWQIVFPNREVSPATGVVKEPKLGSANRAFEEFTATCLLSNTDWLALRADLKAVTTYGSTYPYLAYNYEAAASISLKVAVMAFSAVKANDNEHRVTLTFRERMA